MAFDRAICDERSESLAMLFRACFTEQAINQGILPDEYVFGDVLMIETVHLEPQYRGYGIGLLVVDELTKHVERASYNWSEEGLIVLDPSGLTSDLAQGHSHEEVQEKLIRYWQMLGLRVLVRERKRHCTFVGHWMGDQRPNITAIVPHLFR
jgi:GNAT superfamily N-acetyltransferase